MISALGRLVAPDRHERLPARSNPVHGDEIEGLVDAAHGCPWDGLRANARAIICLVVEVTRVSRFRSDDLRLDWLAHDTAWSRLRVIAGRASALSVRAVDGRTEGVETAGLPANSRARARRRCRRCRANRR